MIETRFVIEVECIESDVRHVLRENVTVLVNGRDPSETPLTADDYAMLDHAFRKADDALDLVKTKLRLAAKLRK